MIHPAGRRLAGATTTLALLLCASSPPCVAADEVLTLCRLVLFEERNELDARGLDVDLARSNAQASEQIFGLLEGLWKNDAVERLVYLTGRHDRDASAIELQQRRHELARQSAVVEQYRVFCEAPGGDGADEALERARRSYLEADCDVRAAAEALAQTDIEFNREVLASVVELRAANVATAQDIIFAERDVETADKRLARARVRAEHCRRALGRSAP